MNAADFIVELFASLIVMSQAVTTYIKDDDCCCSAELLRIILLALVTFQFIDLVLIVSVLALLGGSTVTHFATNLVAASRSTETLRATKVDGIARPSRLERQKSTDRGAREGPRRDFRRYRVDFEINFVVFRGNIARAT